VRFPNLKIALSEGGIGWVPMLLDRLEYMEQHELGSVGHVWDGDVPPSQALKQSFWFCTIDDPSTIDLRHRIGLDHIMLEVDYPHASSTWPDTQWFVEDRMGHLPADEVAMITHGNAEALFRFPLA